MSFSENIPKWALEEAKRRVYEVGDAVALASTQITEPGALADLMIRVTAAAILKAQKDAYEECLKIVDGYDDAMAIAGENGEMLPIAPFISQAIRNKASEIK